MSVVSIPKVERARLSYAPLLLVALLFGVFFLLNPAIVADWRAFSFDDGSYSHAYLILPIAAYLFWDAWQRQELVFTPKPWLLAALAFSLYALFVARLAQFAFLERLLTPVPLLIAFCSIFAIRFAVTIPICMLWFITPIWGVLNAPLQEGSARAVEAAMRVTGIPTFVDGNFVQIPSGMFEIAEGCSGLRYVVSALAIALVYCHLYLRSWFTIALFTTLAVVGAVVTNWLRILLLVLIGHHTEMQSEIIRDHNMFGWYLFIPLMLILMWIGARLEPAPAGPDSKLRASVDSAEVPRGTVSVATALLILLSGMVLAGLSTGTFRLLEEPVAIEGMQPASQPGLEVHPVLHGDGFTHQLVSLGRGSQVPPVHAYDFSGIGTVAKPDFYLNSVIPEGWRSCGDSQFIGQAQRRELCRGRDRALLDVAFRVGDNITARSDDLRLLRLSQAMRLEAGTSLYWWFMPCGQTSCNAPDALSPADAVARDKLSEAL